MRSLRDQAADRSAAAELFSDRDDVGLDARMIDAPVFAGAAEARDHFIGDEERADFVRDGFDRG